MYAIAMNVIPVIATAMLKCVRKQLVDFLKDGKFGNPASDEDFASSDFAPVTNLSC
ncbi:hypothetical protein DPMN_046582 [Dreissena polymorpha]|uniref:Uncharacterized protein n=1 Tax=Dreissena polymorpha TaxID=45954 RepID=A0A9D4D732_DREPO|nr:hypothetical protein DPMN_046582 [Dreissena polymorpha]